MNKIVMTTVIILAMCTIIINLINCKFYSDFIGIKYNRSTKHGKPARLTIKEVKERYYPEYRYEVVSVRLGNYPLWICKDIEEAKERVKCSCQRLYIVCLDDVPMTKKKRNILRFAKK